MAASTAIMETGFLVNIFNYIYFHLQYLRALNEAAKVRDVYNFMTGVSFANASLCSFLIHFWLKSIMGILHLEVYSY